MLQHREKIKHELVANMRHRSQGRWVGVSRAQPAASAQPSASESVPGSPSSARRQGTAPAAKASPAKTSDAGDDDSRSAHPSLAEEEEEPQVKGEDIENTEVIQKILEGLRGEAFQTARDIGLVLLCQYDGIDHPIATIKTHVFPLQSEEASELFRQGQLRTGPLARQKDETMLSYAGIRPVTRKCRFQNLCELICLSSYLGFRALSS